MLSHLGPLPAIGAVYAIVLWLAVAYWALKDARLRSESSTFQTFAMAINLVLPFLGLLIYFLVRPGMTLGDRRALELEQEILTFGSDDEAEVRPCPACGREIESEFILCPYCQTRFAKRCPRCSRMVRLGWALCPLLRHGPRARLHLSRCGTGLSPDPGR